MAINPLARLKHRLSAAIDWRVTQEFDQERDLIRDTNAAILDVSVQHSDQIAALTRLVNQLEQRIEEIERAKR
jgi:alpha-D-ribose 1-methylphosphonate 5-triphosphate synthase subunit PhnG